MLNLPRPWLKVEENIPQGLKSLYFFYDFSSINFHCDCLFRLISVLKEKDFPKVSKIKVSWS